MDKEQIKVHVRVIAVVVNDEGVRIDMSIAVDVFIACLVDLLDPVHSKIDWVVVVEGVILVYVATVSLKIPILKIHER